MIGWAILITGCSSTSARNDFSHLPRYLRRRAEEVRWVMSEQHGCCAVPLALCGLTSISIVCSGFFTHKYVSRT